VGFATAAGSDGCFRRVRAALIATAGEPGPSSPPPPRTLPTYRIRQTTSWHR